MRLGKSKEMIIFVIKKVFYRAVLAYCFLATTNTTIKQK